MNLAFFERCAIYEAPVLPPVEEWLNGDRSASDVVGKMALS
jgi:hypothetical protein